MVKIHPPLVRRYAAVAALTVVSSAALEFSMTCTGCAVPIKNDLMYADLNVS